MPADRRHRPASCVESGGRLRDQVGAYEADGVFPRKVLDAVADRLVQFDDTTLDESLRHNPVQAVAFIKPFTRWG